MVHKALDKVLFHLISRLTSNDTGNHPPEVQQMWLVKTGVPNLP